MTFVLILLFLSLVPLFGGLYFLFKGIFARKRSLIWTGLVFILAWGGIIYQFYQLYVQEFL